MYFNQKVFRKDLQEGDEISLRKEVEHQKSVGCLRLMLNLDSSSKRC